MSRKISALILILFAVTMQLTAQNPYIQNYTTSDGLPSNKVYQVYQDRNRFIWFATDAGVARYDGNIFTYYRKPNGLSSNDIVRIKEDSSGRLWLINFNAAINFFYHDTVFNENSRPFLNDLKAKEFFRDFLEDQNGDLHFYYNHQREVYTLDTGNKVTRFTLPSVPLHLADMDRTAEGMVTRYISLADDGNFHIWASAGFYKMKEWDGALVPVQKNYYIKASFPLGNGHIIAQSLKQREMDQNLFELVRFDENFKRVTGAAPIPLNTEIVSAVLEDSHGILWVSTYDKGVFCYRDNILINHFDIKEAQAVIEDHEENIWISSLKDGVFKMSPYINQHIHYTSGLFDNQGILALNRDRENGVWFTNGQSVYLLQDSAIFRSDFSAEGSSFNQLLQTGPNTLVIGEMNNRFYALKGIKADKSTGFIRYDSIGNYGQHLKKVVSNKNNHKVDAYDVFTIISFDAENLFNITNINYFTERVYNIFYNVDDELIMNSKQNKRLSGNSFVQYDDLARFDDKIITNYLILEGETSLYNVEGDSIYLEREGVFLNLSASFDFPIDLQVRYLDYSDSTLYLATSRNIYLCAHPLKLFTGGPVRLEPVDIGFRHIRDILVNNNKIHIASDDGLTVIPDTKIRQIEMNTPIPYLKSVTLNDVPQALDKLRISSGSNNRIGISFGSINLSSGPVTYAYMVEGLDNEWHSGEAGSVVLQDLPKGQYTFRMKVRKPTSGWSEPSAIPINIKAALYEQPLFILLASLVISGLIVLLILWRKNQEYRQKETQHQLILLEQKALQSMMNPHFIFNALGSIQNFLLQNKPSEAGLFLSQFARLIRQNLASINSPMIRLEEEVDRLKNYLDLEKLRLENKFDYSVRYDDQLKEQELSIPAMIIQPFVENAVWHGVSQLAGNGMIRIFFSRTGDESLKIVIEDNGLGVVKAGAYARKRDKHLHMGMEMTRKRLEILGKQKKVPASVSITEAFPGQENPGTRVEILAPCCHKDNEE